MKRPTAKQIIKARKDAGLTQEQAATLMGYSRRGWQDLEYGKYRMRPIIWEAFVSKLNAKP